ncbi:MAG: ribonuclease III [Phocaeicola sp.]|uniref:ribonuclease III n=1 Tax=Phocaeicola sp. TaxID=2773926 RepID=UPI003FA01F9C
MYNCLIDRIRLLFHKDKESYLRFYHILGFYPHNISYYKQALLHKSLSVKDKGRWVNNERLEFLGDAVLDAVVGDIVYRKFEGKREGFLTNTRSKIVQRETLNRVAEEIGLDKLIKYTTHQSAHNSYLSGNAFEAIIGAIYLDRGYKACQYFIGHRIIGPYIDLNKISTQEVNFKSKLIEWSQKNHFLIDFQLINESHDQLYSPTFESEVTVEGIITGHGQGYSKKESQQKAAKETLEKLKIDKDLKEQIIEAKNIRDEQENPVLRESLTNEIYKDDTASVPAPEQQNPLDVEERERFTTSSTEDIIYAAEEEAYK